jgi:type I restriction enzyme S subunit
MTWHEVTLKQICGVDWGNTKLTKSSYVPSGKFLAVSAAGADGRIDHHEHEANVPVLSAIGAQCGRMFYPNERFTAIKNTITLTPKENMADGKFLYYLFTHVELPQRGAGQPFISKGDIEAFRVSIPKSVEDQTEIVQNLDSAFAEIDLLEENFTKLISLNYSLLSAKINYEFGTIWNSDEMKTLGDFGKISYGYTAKSSSTYKGPKYLRITDIQNKSVNWSEVPNCEISNEEKSKFLLSKGDIVFARTGATTGKSYLIDVEVDAVFASYLIRIKPDPKKLDSEFLYYFFQSAYYWDEIADGISGSAQGGFNASKLQAMGVSFPTDLRIQGEIVKRIREFEVELNLRMGKLLEEANNAKSLRQSILSNAFTQKDAVA